MNNEWQEQRSRTIQELASNEKLWKTYIDPQNNAPFDSLKQEEREQMIRDIWPNTPEESE